jgi:photosystem II stability/assembly factor-like uncharacterized protein
MAARPRGHSARWRWRSIRGIPGRCMRGPRRGCSRARMAGPSWVNVLAGAPVVVYAVAVDPRTSGTIYVGTDDGVLQSTDGGANWSAIAGAPQHVQLLMLDPQNPMIVYAGGTGGLLRRGSPSGVRA